MEQLPFAVDDNDSLLTASSQGSFLPTEEFTKIGHRVTNLFRKHDEEEESVAFYMTDVDDDEVDIWLEPEKEPEDGDGLVRLLTQELAQPHNPLLELCHQANRQSQSAVQARTRGKLPEALQYHTQAAQAFRDAAQLVRDSDGTYVDLSFSLIRSLARPLLGGPQSDAGPSRLEFATDCEIAPDGTRIFSKTPSPAVRRYS